MPRPENFTPEMLREAEAINAAHPNVPTEALCCGIWFCNQLRSRGWSQVDVNNCNGCIAVLHRKAIASGQDPWDVTFALLGACLFAAFPPMKEQLK